MLAINPNRSDALSLRANHRRQRADFARLRLAATAAKANSLRRGRTPATPTIRCDPDPVTGTMIGCGPGNEPTSEH
jgi:hypothetical protein